MISHTMHAPGGRVLLSVLLTVLFTSGCRSYGGHGAEEATYRQMQVAHQNFEEELVRARADLNRLESAASEADVMGILAAQYGQIVRGHEAILEHHANLIEGLSANSDYRDLHRTYGAIIAQQRTIRMQYEGVLEHVQQAYMQQDTTRRPERPYSLIPPYYKRVTEGRRNVSVGSVLAEVRSGRAPEVGFQIMMPEADSVAAADESGANAHGH